MVSVLPTKARLAGGAFPLALPSCLPPTQNEMFSFCGYNLFSLGMTSPCLDLAQGCRSKRLAHNKELPSEPRRKVSSPVPAHFLPLPLFSWSHLKSLCGWFFGGFQARADPHHLPLAHPLGVSTCLPTRPRGGAAEHAGRPAAAR